jgi:hypothetical protein
MSIIGIILLIGIVKKNAIMMIDFALNAERNEGMNTRDSIFEACDASLPAYPDDDDGGAFWRGAAGGGYQGWVRSCGVRWASPSSGACW